MLQQHPQIFLPPEELHYFDKSQNYQRGLDWYLQHFEEADSGDVIGEKTPDYIWANGDGVEGHLSDVHKNVHDALPDIQLIVALRNPVDRAISAAKHIIRSGRVSPRHSLDELLVGSKQHLLDGHGVIDYGHYARHLSAYLSLFERTQILPLFFETDVVESPKSGLKRVYEFLDVTEELPEQGIQQKVNAHRSTLLELYALYYTPMLYGIAHRLRNIFPQSIPPPSQKTVKQLYEHYKPHNEDLRQLLDRDLPESWVPDKVTE
jgi:hypothetical protein